MGISEKQNLHSIKVYPNPGSGHFFVSLDKAKYPESSVEVFNLAGQLIYQSELISNLTEITLDEQARGIYFYRILSAKTILTQGKYVYE